MRIARTSAYRGHGHEQLQTNRIGHKTSVNGYLEPRSEIGYSRIECRSVYAMPVQRLQLRQSPRPAEY